MAKVFTITEGLENMGALKTGGQGSVYKGRRSNGTLSAVKLLPTPILSESEDDKNYSDFKNEVEKLKRVNEEHNPYIVNILSAGITDTGAFPYIEMEFIEGPDLAELLQPPHPPIFTLKEALKVAEHLSNALGHCHSLGVKHGDIKSNNIKLDTRNGNYVLLDFGLAVMSDEQRRTSLRHAGAIEFMAPEQNEGQTLFQTDVYSYGVVLYELLAGQVPFPLHAGGETARNAVMVAHMEEPVPDLLALRRQHMPADWSEEQKLQEMLVPRWLLQTLERCLQKRPQDRFLSGIELHDHVVQHLSAAAIAPPAAVVDEHWERLHRQNEELARRNEELRQQLTQVREPARPAPTVPLGAAPLEESRAETSGRTYSEPPRRKSGMSSAVLVLLALLVVGGGIAGYTLLKDNRQDSYTASDDVTTTSTTEETQSTETDYPATAPLETEPLAQTVTDTAYAEQAPVVTDTATEAPPTVAAEATAAETREESKPKEETKPQETTEKKEDTKDEEEEPKMGSVGSYKVVNKAFFHNEPDEATRRNAFIIHWNNAVLKPTKEENGFVYVVFTNHQGQTSRGWLKKSDLVEVKE